MPRQKTKIVHPSTAAIGRALNQLQNAAYMSHEHHAAIMKLEQETQQQLTGLATTLAAIVDELGHISGRIQVLEQNSGHSGATLTDVRSSLNGILNKLAGNGKVVQS